MICREANTADIRNIYHIYKNEVINDVLLKVQYQENDFQKILDNTEKAELLVAHINNNLVGFLLAFDHITWGYVDILYVKPEYRKKGAAKVLIATLMERRSGWQVIELCYDSDDDESGMAANKLDFKNLNKTQYKWAYKFQETK